ncbi:MAG: hypothetical protein ACE5K3_10035 [bacterium]
MIIQELKAQFNEYFQSSNAELILWLDPERQWRGVIEHFNDFRIVEFKGSQLEVKAEVELTWDKGERPKFVLYLGGLSREDLTVLREYEFSGKVFEETLLAERTQHSLNLTSRQQMTATRRSAFRFLRNGREMLHIRMTSSGCQRRLKKSTISLPGLSLTTLLRRSKSFGNRTLPRY